ncbi:putative mitochondrial protein [Sesamum angolense]|uniref:Mitochondrial protein n=1 Tax=Sesamum angolense TaxID=2727404 RepID=A0AAE1T8R4_9LAMI|nr:putative mitochondrial protein [Sesamum angolense]
MQPTDHFGETDRADPVHTLEDFTALRILKIFWSLSGDDFQLNSSSMEEYVVVLGAWLLLLINSRRRCSLPLCFRFMDQDIHRMGRALNLSEDEEQGVIIPLGVWHGESDRQGFFLVGRILSTKPFHPEALKTVLQSAFNLVKGMDFKVIEDNRFLIRFNHVLDLEEDQNPADIDLNWCDFHVLVQGLPLGKMTREMAEFVRNKLGRLCHTLWDLAEGSPPSRPRARNDSHAPIQVFPQPVVSSARRASPTRSVDEDPPRRGSSIFGFTHDLPECTVLIDPTPVSSPQVSATISHPPNPPAPLDPTVQPLHNLLFLSVVRPEPLSPPIPPTKPNQPPPPSENYLFPLPQTSMNLPTLIRNPIPTPNLSQTSPTYRRGCTRSTLCWNCQGLWGLGKCRGLKNLVRTHHPSLVFLAETKCNNSRIEYVKQKLDWFGFGVPSKGKSGGLALLWDKSVSVQLQSFSEHHIDATVLCDDDRDSWRFTGIYGAPEIGNHFQTWSLLSRLSSQSCRPWLCAGDYNEILKRDEKQGGVDRLQWQIQNFRSALQSAGLHDLGFVGSPFTWCNNHAAPDTKRVHLNRACGNPLWSQMFPETTVTHLNSALSDHAPIIISTTGSVVTPTALSRLWRKQGHRLELQIREIKRGPISLEPRRKEIDLRDKLDACSRRRVNAIDRMDEGDRWNDDPAALRRLIERHFSRVFDSDQPSTTEIEKGKEHIACRIDYATAQALAQPFTKEEVVRALFQMAPMKSPGQISLVGGLEHEGTLQGVSVCRNAPPISHLLFVGDTLIFSQASEEAMRGVARKLEIYAQVSGQAINLNKSYVVFSCNVNVALHDLLANILGIRRVAQHDLYLGLPSILGKSQKAVFSSLRDKIWNQISGWNKKMLSQTGKGMLIKAVLQSIPTYAMGVFRLPEGVLRDIQSLCADFWWHNQGHRKVHWIAWDKLCARSVEGGLGFREFLAFNQAMLAKQCWRVFTNPHSLLGRLLP